MIQNFDIILLIVVVIICICGFLYPVFYRRFKEVPKQIVPQKEEKQKWDVVYILRNDIDEDNEELKYSLRSLENFEYNKVCFAGGAPSNLVPDYQLEFEQEGHNKWRKVRNTIEAICNDPNISENFWLFNDDFFILKPYDQDKVYYNGTIPELIQRLEAQRGKGIAYVKHINRSLIILQENEMPIKNYSLHMPMLINKEKGKEVLEKFQYGSAFRNLYGNYVDEGNEVCADCKISTPNILPEDTWGVVSTNERVFGYGEIGKFIREKFQKKSRFEIEEEE